MAHKDRSTFLCGLIHKKNSFAADRKAALFFVRAFYVDTNSPGLWLESRQDDAASFQRKYAQAFVGWKLSAVFIFCTRLTHPMTWVRIPSAYIR